MFRRHFFEEQYLRHHSRMFERGDMKYVVLDLLNEKPRHGYEIMRDLQEKSHGFYSPSAGSIYPTLQMLEDMGYVKAVESDGKKTYSITDEGKKHLKENAETMDRIKRHTHEWHGAGNREEIREIMSELFETGRLLRTQVHDMEPDKLKKIKEIISKACKEIHEIAVQ